MPGKRVIFSIPPKTHEQMLFEATAKSVPLIAEKHSRLFIEAAHEFMAEVPLDPRLGYCIWQAIARCGLDSKPLSRQELESLRGLLADNVTKADYLEAAIYRVEIRLGFRFAKHVPLYREIQDEGDSEKSRDLQRAIGVVCLAWQVAHEPGSIGIFSDRRIQFESSDGP